MKLRFNFLFYLLGAGVMLVGCSTKKDSFVNRNWHALNTKYNVLYNGNLAFEEGREQLNESYRDNYWEILPVERLEVSGEIKLDSEDNNPNFLKAEEKAAKAIQKHSMDISDLERNPQTDEAFLLLGKSRYFDERYIPALEAFNYVLRKYEESDKLNEATIWREKTNIRLGYEELAIENLKRLFKFERLKDQEYADARAIMGQAYINLNAPDTAIQELKTAVAYTRKPAERGRYLFIIGQLFNQLDYKDSANIAFDKIIALNRRIPRVYLINAHLRKIQNTPVDPENEEDLLEYLTELEEDRENRPFLDIIYRQLAEHHQQTGSDSLALSYYNQSLRKTQLKPQLNALNYQDLADHYFDENSYRTAGAYYDSVLLNLDENTRTFRAIRKKRDNLDDVIAYEEVVQYTDSVIQIYNMSPVEREIYFQNHIDSLKAVAEAEALKKEQQASTGFAAFAETKGGKQNKGKFYFYNITSLGYGKTAFTNKWGNRELEDNWRWSNKARILTEQEALTADLDSGDEADLFSEEQRYSLDFYLDRIPKDPLVVDSLQHERNFANYQLGLIYKEKFKELMLAAGKLERVLASNPEERLILPSKYNLLKIYEAVDSPLWEDMRSDIIQNHPDSRYAAILTNPEIELSALENSPDSRYGELFRAFREQRFLEVITGAEKSINQFTGDPIVPKLELLKANAIGRLQGFIAFKEALNYVALNYPNSPEGKQAQTMIDEQIPQLENKEFSRANDSKGRENWKVVFPFKRYQVEEAEKLAGKLEKSLKDLNYKNRVSRDIYDLEDAYVVVHGFPSRDFALGYLELLKNNKDYLIERENFVILSSNYKIIQVHKNIDDYRNTIQSPKP
ncbi:type IX secretion system periplasmic lipoprotein PorW/SprE [Robiginitalea sp. IMCC43444]|uniref:type IX secretion system periplasmic lipoprotein PorW/SprE n=1 Tax=Robiginitalea sp. IMCC43444 TaxID=3459121 RepID=UPI00404362BF